MSDILIFIYFTQAAFHSQFSMRDRNRWKFRVATIKVVMFCRGKIYSTNGAVILFANCWSHLAKINFDLLLERRCEDT